MSRRVVKLTCSAEVRKELERNRSHVEPRRRVERARMILSCMEGRSNEEVAGAHETSPNRVGKWRNRFAAPGLAGLEDAPRPGKPASVGKTLRDAVLSLLETPPPQ